MAEVPPRLGVAEVRRMRIALALPLEPAAVDPRVPEGVDVRRAARHRRAVQRRGIVVQGVGRLGVARHVVPERHEDIPRIAHRDDVAHLRVVGDDVERQVALDHPARLAVEDREPPVESTWQLSSQGDTADSAGTSPPRKRAAGRCSASRWCPTCRRSRSPHRRRAGRSGPSSGCRRYSSGIPRRCGIPAIMSPAPRRPSSSRRCGDDGAIHAERAGAPATLPSFHQQDRVDHCCCRTGTEPLALGDHESSRRRREDDRSAICRYRSRLLALGHSEPHPFPDHLDPELD